MSGGAWEYTAAYANNSHANLNNGNNLLAKANKYKTVYTSALASEAGLSATDEMSKNNYNKAKEAGLYGDATVETSSVLMMNAFPQNLHFLLISILDFIP